LCLHAKSDGSNPQHADSTSSASLPYESTDGSADNARHRCVHPLIGLDFRQTWIGLPNNEDIPIRMWGVRAGVSIHHRHRMGLGYAFMHHVDLTDKEGAPIHLKYRSLSVFYEYYFLDTKHWSMGAPVEAGIGHYSVQAQDDRLDGKSANVTAAGIALDLHYRPIRWLSLNTVGGYRWASNSGPINLSNWFFSLGFSVPLGHVVQDIRHRHKQSKSLSCKS
jgi:hypothetical protein